jgi:hypothetical protein
MSERGLGLDPDYQYIRLRPVPSPPRWPTRLTLVLSALNLLLTAIVLWRLYAHGP